MQMPGHGAPDDSLNKEEFYSSPCPLLLLQKKAWKEKLELKCLVDVTPQTPELAMRITKLMTQLETYKVIIKNQKDIFFVLHEINYDSLIFNFYIS